jgi:hypothetical protein
MENEKPPLTLADKLSQKLSQMSSRRTGKTLRSARKMVKKDDKNKLMREVRKNGVKALTKRLGITDPETERMVASMVATGDVSSAEDLIARIQSNAQNQERKRVAQQMQDQGPPMEVQSTAEEPIATLPGASMKRKTLKPLRAQFASVSASSSFESWLSQK